MYYQMLESRYWDGFKHGKIGSMHPVRKRQEKDLNVISILKRSKMREI